MNIKTTVLLLMIGGVAVFTTSCQNINSSGITVESYQHTQVKENSRIFGQHFRVVQSVIAKGNNDLLLATITLENLKKDCQFEYRYRWLDAKGIEIRSGTSIWMPVAVAAREQKLLSGVAPSKNASDFILDIRFNFKSTRW